MYTIHYTEKAEADLQEILYYVALDSGSRETTIRLWETIQKSIQVLETFPEAGVRPRFSPIRKQGYRMLPSGRYLIFYKVQESSGQIMISRILHGAREYTAFL